MNLYLLISEKKKIFAYVQYLACLYKILQSLSFRIPSWGKKWLSLSQVTIFPDKNFDPILSNPNFSFPAYHVSFNSMSCGIDIIFAGIGIFDDLAIFAMLKDFLNWKWHDFVTWFSLCCNAIIGPSCQHFGNVVDMKVWNHIAMYNSYYHLNHLCKVDICCIFTISLKVLYGRRCQLLLS